MTTERDPIAEAAAHSLAVQLLEVPDGTVVVVRVDTRVLSATLGAEERVQGLLLHLSVAVQGLMAKLAAEGRHTNWLLVPEGLELAEYTEADMNAAGWYRQEAADAEPH